jgi:hypothetical protein
MRRRGVGRSAQDDQYAKGQNRSHHICSAIIDIALICAHARPLPQAEPGFTINQIRLMPLGPYACQNARNDN